MWECGLKRRVRGPAVGGSGVTPYVGVWIETIAAMPPRLPFWCHSLCGSVD